MNSREIVIDLINKQIIDGEQAFVLINDLLKAELMEAWETLYKEQTDKKSNTFTDLNKIWVNSSPYSISTYGNSGTVDLTSVSSK